MDFALFVLRVVIGALFVGHGAQKLFGWFGGHGLEGTGGYLESLGYRPGRTHAALAGTTEFVSGLMLITGFLVPLAAAGIIGVMVNAIGSVHADQGLWAGDGGYEYPLVLVIVALVLAIAGAGGLAATELDGAWWGAFALLLGGLAGLLLLSGRAETAEAQEAETEVEDERPAA